MSEKIEYNFASCLGSVVENLTFVLGMGLMFSKTVDLLTAFAPTSFMGYVGVEGYYGLACGLLVEGALVVMKFLLPYSKNPAQWLWNAALILTPFLISALAQPIDSMIVRQTIVDQPQEIQLFVTWFVPSIPTLIIGMFIGKSILDSMPEEFLPKGMPVWKRPNVLQLNPFSKNGKKEAQGNFTSPPQKEKLS